jgi:hypothetical protein
MKRSWKIVAVVGGALLVNAPQAFADLKSVFTAVCDAHDDTIVSTAGPTPAFAKDGKPIAFCFAPPESNCRSLMVCMDQAGWHVIHDTRYGGAWAESPVLGFPTAEAFYKLIFQKD